MSGDALKFFGATTLKPTGDFEINLGATNESAFEAQKDLTSAYNQLAGIQAFHDMTGKDLAGKVLTSGTYRFSSSAALGAGDLTLDGGANDAWVFQVGSTFTASNGSRVLLEPLTVGGPLPLAKNVYWTVGSSVTIIDNASMQGNFLAYASITMSKNATVNGLLGARTGAITLEVNTLVNRKMHAFSCI
jgi:hypothetical protein